jgi:hypothetical protein
MGHRPPHFMLPMLTTIAGGMYQHISSTDSFILKMITAIYTKTLKELEHITHKPQKLKLLIMQSKHHITLVHKLCCSLKQNYINAIFLKIIH